MVSSTNGLIGLEELGPEPCDGTGEDVMSRRARRKWHVGVPAGPRTANDAGLQAVDYASYGAYVKNRRWHDRKAQFLYALWQQSVRPVLPKPIKPLNRDVLAKIASRAAEMHLRWADRANGVVAACTVNKHFYETVLRQLEACNMVAITTQSVGLCGPHGGSMNGDLFATLCDLGSLVFPEVHFSDGGFAESIPPKLHGIERLFLPNGWRGSTEQLKQLLEKNKDSLKVLKMHSSLLSSIPEGLQLEEFSCTNPHEISLLETKIFKCEYIWNSLSLPPPFIRKVNADEVRIEARGIQQPDPMDTLPLGPANQRVKKLTITVPPIVLPDLARLFRDVAAMCPMLECFELVQDSKFYTAGHDRLDLADRLAANIQGVMERSAPFKICLKMNVMFVAHSWHDASDFVRRLLDADLPPPEEVYESKKPLRLFREESGGAKTLRVDCEIFM